MTLQEEIMAKRQAQGLQIIMRREDGSLFTVYPKDQATKERWLAAYRRKGVTICAS